MATTCHTWTQKRPERVSAETWALIVEDAKAIFAVTPTKICYDANRPKTKPRITTNAIEFNGALLGGAEAFFMTRAIPPESSRSCTTMSRPYNLIVMAVLLAIIDRDPEYLTIRSTGSPEAWKEALEWTANVLKRPIQMPF